MTFMYSSFVRVPLPSSASSGAPSGAAGDDSGVGAGASSSSSTAAASTEGGAYDLYLYREDGFVEQS